MKNIGVKLSPEEHELLMQKVERTGRSISEIVRDSLFKNESLNSDISPASSIQFQRLEAQLSIMQNGIESLTSSRENDSQIDALMFRISELNQGQSEALARAEKAEKQLEKLNENVSGLIDHLIAEQQKPYGLRLGFVQGTLQAMNVMAQCMREDRSKVDATSKDFERYGKVMLDRSRPDWTPEPRQ